MADNFEKKVTDYIGLIPLSADLEQKKKYIIDLHNSIKESFMEYDNEYTIDYNKDLIDIKEQLLNKVVKIANIVENITILQRIIKEFINELAKRKTDANQAFINNKKKELQDIDNELTNLKLSLFSILNEDISSPTQNIPQFNKVDFENKIESILPRPPRDNKIGLAGLGDEGQYGGGKSKRRSNKKH